MASAAPHPIKDKTVVVTGAASGIGRALALGFAADGARVIAADINAAGLLELSGDAITTVVADVSRDPDVRQLMATALKDTGRIDVLFNNAGLGGSRRIKQIDDDMFERYIQVHLFGAFYGTRAAMPAMRA